MRTVGRALAPTPTHAQEGVLLPPCIDALLAPLAGVSAMDQRYVRAARAAVAALVFVTAAYHFYWGFPRSLIYARALGSLVSRGLPPDPRPFLFVAYALALFGGPYLVTRGKISLHRAYQLGLVAMILSFLGWVFWHETGHGAFLTGSAVPDAGGDGHSHGGVLRTIAEHYVVEPVEGVIKSVELLATALFAFLLRYDPDAE